MKMFSKFFFRLPLVFAVAAFAVGVSSCSDDDSSNGGDNGSKEVFNPAGEDGILKILAIGNSFTEDCVEQYLYELFSDAGIETVIGNLYHGGCTLEMHYNYALLDGPGYSYRKIVNGVKTTTEDATMLLGIFDEDWDYICFHQRSYLAGIYDEYFPYLPYLMQYARDNARNENMEIALHLTWAYPEGSSQSGFENYDNDQMIMYNAIVETTKRVVGDVGINIVIPSGTAVQNGRNSYLGDTFNRDDQHLNYTYGRYTAACTWFETFSGIDVTTTSYKPSTIDDETKDVSSHAAHFAVQNPYEVNPMTDWQ